MPYYYLISEVVDITPDEPTRGWSKCSKPETYDLLLPSIHASRNHNVLHAGDPEEAVAGLLADCHDSTTWPSSRYSCNNQNPNLKESDTIHRKEELVRPQAYHSNVESVNQDTIPEVVLPKIPVYSKYRLPFWSQNVMDPHVIDAARSLFFERMKQRAVYNTNHPSWDYNVRELRMSTDYELFVAWASLSRAEKMKYVSEVTGDWTVGSSLQPTNTLETERAVNILYSCCPDAASWPSLEYLRLQQNQCSHPPLRVPRLHHFQ